ncbi:MAG: molybdopterin-guanine dinucleotide biosynthesis protein B [Desulfatibacillaceae bacterium]
MSANHEKTSPPAIVCIVGPSDSGKTTFVEQLIPELRASGLCVATVKHSMHGFDLDRSGKDTCRHKQAGADATVAACPGRIALFRDVEEDMPLSEIAERYLSDADLVVAEGYKRDAYPKILVTNPAAADKPLPLGDGPILATVRLGTAPPGERPRFRDEDVRTVARKLIAHFDLGGEKTSRTAAC